MKSRADLFSAVDLEALEADIAAPAALPASPASGAPVEQEASAGDSAPALLVGAPVGVFDADTGLRSNRLADLKLHRNAVAELAQDLQDEGANASERNEASQRLSRLQDEVEHLEQSMSRTFIPQHGELQLISPEYLLVTRLFNVRGKQSPRQRMVSFDIARGDKTLCTYVGPELRQAEGHVFMTLLNLTRDFKVGTEVSFNPGEFCTAMNGYYDGKSRQRLKDAIKRLMHAVVSFPDFSVHLVQRFNHPSSGDWSVVLDNDIVRLFQKSSYVWLDVQTRRELPEGLATWLYGYVRSQARLIPVQVSHLRQECGSDAKDDDSFRRRLTVALAELADKDIIDKGWSIRAGQVRWRKPMPPGAGMPALPA